LATPVPTTLRRKGPAARGERRLPVVLGIGKTIDEKKKEYLPKKSCPVLGKGWAKGSIRQEKAQEKKV